ncbi:MAG: alpha/beta hydrolase [Pseudomonadota bacterium]
MASEKQTSDHPRLELDAWLAAGDYVTTPDGHRVFYRDSQGDLPALVLLHGFPTASWDWHKLWPALTMRYRVVAPDFLGFGFSDKPPTHDYSISEQAYIVETLLASLGIRHTLLVAHDYGDTVAQELMARVLDRQRSEADGVNVHAVCLLNGGLFPETHRARLIQKLLVSPVGPLLSRLMNERRLASSLGAVFGPDTQPDERELAEFWRVASHNDGHRLSHRLLHYMGERVVNRERWVAALAQAPMPLRLIVGEVDPVSGTHMAERYAELVPRPDIVKLPGIGHYPQTEAPQQVLGAITEHFDALP